MSKITAKSVAVADLSIQQDGDEYTIGSIKNATFIRVPYEAVVIVEYLNGENSVEDIQRLCTEKHNFEVDVLDFVETLHDLELISSIDGVDCLITETVELPKEPSKFMAFLMNIAYSKPAIFTYITVVVASIVLMVINPKLLPSFEHMFAFKSLGLSIIFAFFTDWTLNFFHEFSHYLAARRLNVPTKFSLSLRYIYLVIEAEMTGLWSVNRKKRITPFMAGMAWESVIFFICIIIQLNSIGIMFNIAQTIKFMITFRILWQFMFFLRTDIYFVITTLLTTSNLSENANHFIFKTFGYKRKNSQEIWNELDAKEQKHSKWFACSYVIGIAAATVLFVAFTIPITYRVLSVAITSVTKYSINNAMFFDGFVTLLILAINLVLWGIGAYTRFNQRSASVNQQS